MSQVRQRRAAISENMKPKTDTRPTSAAVDLGSCALFGAWWAANGVVTQPAILGLSYREVAEKAWRAAVDAAAAHVKGQALTPEEIEDGTKWADDATEHIAEAMRRALLPNVQSGPRGS